MGGWGSGRRRTRTYLEHLPKLMVRDLAPDMLGQVRGDPIHHARIEADPGLAPVVLVPTPQRFGGVRMWFLCGCGRRCGVLYEWRQRFACRRCVGHPYASQHVGDVGRIRRKAFRLYDAINVNYRVAPRQRGPKPKGMRWTTYWAIYEQAHRLDTQALLASVSGRHILRRLG